MSVFFENLAAEIGGIAEVRMFGRVVAVQGLLIECVGLQGVLGIGGRCRIAGQDSQTVTCETVGFREDRVLLMPFEPLEGVTLGAKVELVDHEPAVRPTANWLGRVINALGEPIDGRSTWLSRRSATSNPPKGSRILSGSSWPTTRN